MNRIQGWLVGVDQGMFDLFSHFNTEGEMWVGEGERSVQQWVDFSEAFAEPPSVNVHVSLWDFGKNSTVWFDIWAEDITEMGFNVIFKTWGDTRVARIRVNWQAVGQARECYNDSKIA